MDLEAWAEKFKVLASNRTHQDQPQKVFGQGKGSKPRGILSGVPKDPLTSLPLGVAPASVGSRGYCR